MNKIIPKKRDKSLTIVIIFFIAIMMISYLNDNLSALATRSKEDSTKSTTTTQTRDTTTTKTPTRETSTTSSQKYDTFFRLQDFSKDNGYISPSDRSAMQENLNKIMLIQRNPEEHEGEIFLVKNHISDFIGINKISRDKVLNNIADDYFYTLAETKVPLIDVSLRTKPKSVSLTLKDQTGKLSPVVITREEARKYTIRF